METKNKRLSAIEEIFAASPDFLLRRTNLVFVSVLLFLVLLSTQITFPQITNVHVILENGELLVADLGSRGDVDSGQSAVLSVASFPPGEYGYLKGLLVRKADGALTVKLTNGVTTTSNTQIQLRNGLQADAEVVIGEVSLLQRLIRN